jgi:RimJ/RimL family protein N-acetyltransferase
MATETKTFELQPHLVGELVELRPVRAEDWEGLYRAASDPKVWEQHPAWDRYQEAVFREFFQGALDSGGAFAAIERQSGQIIGSSRYAGYDSQTSTIEIGWSFLAWAYWGGKYNGEMKRLMLEHAFGFVDRVIFLIGATNTRSRKAIEKIGGVLTDQRFARELHGQMYEHVVYEIRKA